jgi:putative MATE family efflux protein
MKAQDLTRGPVLKTLISFAIPFLISNILQSLYGAVDLYMVGRFCNAESLAAVSVGTQVTQIVTSLITGLTLSSTILVGEYTGRKEPENIKATIGTSLTLFTIVALLLTAGMLIFGRPILRLLNTPIESLELTMSYVAICAGGNLFICGYNAISAILRGYGDSVRPMIFVGIACAINVVLDYIFVKYCGLGVAGAALATVISQTISMTCAILYLKSRNFIFDFRLRSFIPNVHVVKRLLFLGFPISLQELLVRISFLYLMAVMNHCGVTAASVIGVSSKFDTFAMLSATSIANALTAITAQNIGAGKPERARRALWYGLTFAVSVASLFWLWAQLNPNSMLHIFTDDQSVIEAGSLFFRSCSYDYILVSIVFCLNGYLNGRQKTLWTMISCGFGALGLRIPIVWYFGTHFPSDMRMLGCIAPFVSGVMACYTLIYVLWEGRKNGRKKVVFDR